MPAEKHWASIREAGHDLMIKNGVQELVSSPRGVDGWMGRIRQGLILGEVGGKPLLPSL